MSHVSALGDAGQGAIDSSAVSAFVPRAGHSDINRLAAEITRAASLQTYTTIRLFVDRGRRAEAMCAYAYFRWADDMLDVTLNEREACLDFVARQQALLNGDLLPRFPQENMMASLLAWDADPQSGLRSYLTNMMRVMAFDAGRRGRLINAAELTIYTGWLATAVTDALHYFIGHGDALPLPELRYRAVTGAHITHLLRDTAEDVRAGYFNIPAERLADTDPCDWSSQVYTAWSRDRVAEARACFADGRRYLRAVPSRRCRIAGYAYTARFEQVLRLIERDGFQLRESYPERRRPSSAVRMLGSVLAMAVLPASRAS